MAGDTDNSCNRCGLVIQGLSAMLQHRRNCSSSSSSSVLRQTDSCAASHSSAEDFISAEDVSDEDFIETEKMVAGARDHQNNVDIHDDDEYLLIPPSSRKGKKVPDSLLLPGKVVKVFPQKGFGFIKADSALEFTDKDVFFHVRSVVNNTRDDLVLMTDSIVQFSLNKSPKDESKPEAYVVHFDVNSSKMLSHAAISKTNNNGKIKMKMKTKQKWITGSVVSVRQDKNCIFIKPFSCLPEKYNAKKDVYARFNMIPNFFPKVQQG